MPIKDLSDVRRMPRIGKIRLGIKVEPEGKKPYPRATDYFVVPEEIKEIVGEMPKKLNIMFPTERAEDFAQQWLRCYSLTQGLICKGDGVKAVRKVDAATGEIASHTTEKWVRQDWGCEPEKCKQYSEKQCRQVMNLLFLMPEVPGIGVWQLDTTSFYSIVNINSCLAVDGLIRRLCGRISFIPLVLSLEPQIVEPEGIKKKTVNILNIRSEAKLIEIQKMGRIPPERILLPELDEDEVPGDLIPEKVIVEAEAKREPQAKPIIDITPNDIAEDDVLDMNAVVRLCLGFWEMQPADICGEFGYGTMAELENSRESPWVVWLTIKLLKQPEAPDEEPPPVPEPGEEPPPAGPEEEAPLWPEDLPGAESSSVAPEPEPEPEPKPETTGFIDRAQLEKQLKALRDKKLSAFSEKNLLSYMKLNYNVEAKTVLEAALQLDEGAANHFMKKLQEALPMI